MSDSVQPAIAETDGPAALPRRNGELVFDAPWESRAFAIAVGAAGEIYDWTDFRAELIDRIAESDADDDQSGEWSYYEHWLLSLETMLVERGVISAGELSRRVEQVADAQAHEHEHEHEHEHDHHHDHDRDHPY